MRKEWKQLSRNEPLRFAMNQARASFSEEPSVRYPWCDCHPYPRRFDPMDLIHEHCYFANIEQPTLFRFLHANTTFFWREDRYPKQAFYHWRWKNYCFLCTLAFKIIGVIQLPQFSYEI